MPINYIGRTTYYSGKKLMDLLCNLKKFGVGRMVYRKHFADMYKEPSYFIIKNVNPDMSNPSGKNKDSTTNTKIVAHQIFRGEDKGEIRLNAHWKADWRLVPKAEEHVFRDQPVAQLPRVEVPDTTPFPPLLERFLMDKMRKEGNKNPAKPRLKLDITVGRNNRAVLVSADDSQS